MFCHVLYSIIQILIGTANLKTLFIDATNLEVVFFILIFRTIHVSLCVLLACN